MKIKTITCHNVYNYGASLQAHALMNYLEEQGHQVEIIDYMPEYIRKTLSIGYMGKKWRKKNILIKLAFYIYVIPTRMMQYPMRKKFKKFNQHFLKLTQRYESWDELKKQPPIADIYFCGSDQIWNTNIHNGLDPAFYCDFAPYGTIRASYAASFSISSLPQEHKDFVKNKLEQMNFISVREKTGLNILEKLKIQTGVHVIDPVFLKSKNDWLEMCYTPMYKNYILIYDQENNPEIKAIAMFLKKKTRKKIIAFKNLYPMSYADIQIHNAGPIDFISYISCADTIITNSFHCSAFSLIMQKQFFVVPRTHQKVNSRMIDLLEYIGNKDHFISSTIEIEKASPINFNESQIKIQKLIDFSKKYIDQVLKSKL
jgi:hypothetical protein